MMVFGRWTVLTLASCLPLFALTSCGGTSGGSGGRPRDGGADEATGTFQCAPDADLEATLLQVDIDGGVGVEQYVRAMSIARCQYWGRCFALAPYVTNECVGALVAAGSWTYWSCPSKTTCAGSTHSYSSAALVQAVDAGTLRYDPERAGQCVTALLAEGCAADELVEAVPACTGVFTCAAGGDAGGSGSADSGADAAAACAELLPNWTPLVTCSTASDCLGVDSPQGPYCVSGLCSASPCELVPGSCVAYAQLGEPCVTKGYNVLGPVIETPTETCAPGLACASAADGGTGACITPQDVGGACTSLAECKPGLVCPCGVCQIPPSVGPCADHLCKVGVAYCDFDTNLCKPVNSEGASCKGLDSCAPGLTCDGARCQPPS